MGLQYVARNPADTGDGALNLASIKTGLMLAALSGGVMTGIQLEAGEWNVRADAATGLVAALTLGTSTIGGADVMPGASPITTLRLVGTDSVGAAPNAGLVGNTGSRATNLIVRDLILDGGRAALRSNFTTATWNGGVANAGRLLADFTGGCIVFSGQQDYPAGDSRHGVRIINCDVFDGACQQIGIYSVKGYTFNKVRTWATGDPTQASHGCDFDAVAYERPACFGYALNCSFDAWGQESIKHENSTDMLYESCVIRQYVTLDQDPVAAYASLERIVFKNCTIDSHVQAGNLKRRFTPGSFVTRTDAVAIALPGATLGSIGSTTGGIFVAADVGRVIVSGADAGIAVIRSVTAGNAEIRVVKAFAGTTLAAGTWTVRGRHFRPAVALTLVGSWATVGASITTSAGDYPFTTGNVGQIIGFYSERDGGAATITSVSGALGAEVATLTVVDAFALASVAANSWVLISGDNDGAGDVTFDSCTFTENGVICGVGAHANKYGTQTIVGNIFSRAGNSAIFPAGTTIVASGNQNYALPVKRFARPAVNPKVTFLGIGPGGGLSQYARHAATTNINTAVTAALAGEEVWALNGVYVAAATGANRGINCGGKAITLRAETTYGALIDASGGSSWTGFAQSADVTGHLISGFVVYGAGLGGGNGAGATITAGKSYMRAMAFIGCKTGNNGAGLRITTDQEVTIEDFTVSDCDSGATAGAVHVLNAAPVGTVTLRRGRVMRNVATGVVAGVRLSNANVVVDGLEVFGNSGALVGGVYADRAANVKNLTAAGNAGTTAHDVGVANNVTLTGSSWVCWSDNASAVKAVNVTGPGGTLNLTSSTLRGGVAAITGGGVTTGVVAPLTADPLFVDIVGGNYQLQAGSPARGTGAANADIYDAFNRPFGYSAATAHQGAWA